MSSVVIGVASTAPAYSLAATLGAVTAVVGIGFQAPIIMVLAFVPMLFVALGFKYLNQADPDCGTTFTWCARAFGPDHRAGSAAGGIIFADVLVMASLAQIAGAYTFRPLRLPTNLANSKLWVGVAGVIWIVLMGLDLRTSGIEAIGPHPVGTAGSGDRDPRPLLRRRAGQGLDGTRPGGVSPAWSWLNPFDIKSFGAMSSGLLLAIFIYWGWDTAVSVNEETEDATQTPGRAAVVQHLPPARDLRRRLGGGAGVPRDRLPEQQLRRRARRARQGRARLAVDKLLIIAVLTSAAASTQTTILPTTRATLSMASHGACPGRSRRSIRAISPRASPRSG